VAVDHDEASGYLDLGRFWQIRLTVGLFGWIAISFAASAAGSDVSISATGHGSSSNSAPAFYAVGLIAQPQENFIHLNCWRVWAVNLWVEVGRVDVCINNAGLSAPYGPTAHVPIDLFEAAVKTNVLGTYHGSVVALRYFLPRGSRKVINLLGRGDRQAVAFQNSYAASKPWVHNFTLALAREYRGSGVGIFAFNPGLMYTDLIAHAEAITGFEQGLRPVATVMRIWGQSPEIAAARLARLASSETDGKTGLEVRLLTPGHMAAGVARELFNRVRGRVVTKPVLHTRSVPPALK
jgi:NAD(P)-dependent dehydrogenase (short-subunit alcohol dehydrogenase family)